MVFAFGQCYSGGFDALAFMGPKIVVASATNETSHAKFVYGNSLAYYKWVKALIA